MKKQPKIRDTESKHVFTVEECEPGIFQSVFPARLADRSQLHTTPADAWEYIQEIRQEDEYGDDHPARMSAAVRGAL